MSNEDRTKWNQRYSDASAAPSQPSIQLTGMSELLPTSGRALDIAGGAGRHAIWLAQRGLNVTLVDISPPGLEIARQRAEAAGVQLDLQCLDLEQRSLPEGPFDLIVSFHFLLRQLFQQIPQRLVTGGLLVVLQPTKRNLERHDRPPEPFLLEEGELRDLAAGLEIVRYEEGWLAEGRHDAVLIARRPHNPSE